MKLDHAIGAMKATYQSLDVVARGLPVDPKEVSDALKMAEPGSEDHLVLSVLAKWNPLVQEVKPVEEVKIVKKEKAQEE